MSNVETRKLFAADADYVAEMRWQFAHDPEGFLKEYIRLVYKLDELLATERLLRKEVLHKDSDSRCWRWFGVQLAEHYYRCEHLKVRCPASLRLANGSAMNHEPLVERPSSGDLGDTVADQNSDLRQLLLDLRYSDIVSLLSIPDEEGNNAH